MTKHSTFLLSLAFIFLAKMLLAQHDVEPNSSKLTHNTISLTAFHPTFFDGNTLFGKTGSLNINSRMIGLGLQYERQIAPNHSILAEVSLFGNYYAVQQEGYVPRQGYVWNRNMRNLSAAFLYHFCSTKNVQVAALGGLLFRYGTEAIRGKYDRYGDYFFESYGNRDLGISAGLRTKISFLRNFQFSQELRFTEFIYRADKNRHTRYDNFAGKGATRHFLNLKIGLGYQF